MKISAYVTLTSLTADDIFAVRPAAQREMRKITAANLIAYLRTPTVPAYMLTAGSNRMLLETGEQLLLEAYNGTDHLLQNLDELTAPEFGDLLVTVEALSGATKSLRLSELAAYLVVVTEAPATVLPHLLTEAGDTLVSEASEPIQVE